MVTLRNTSKHGEKLNWACYMPYLMFGFFLNKLLLFIVMVEKMKLTFAKITVETITISTITFKFTS